MYARMEDFVKKRTDICKNCPIARMTEFGLKCDDRKWLNVVNNTSSFFKKDGWIKGCGCIIQVKVKNINNRCPAGKW